MIKDLIRFATHLDSIGLTKEADYVDRLVFKLAQENNDEDLEAMENLEKVSVRYSKMVLNQFFGTDVFADPYNHAEKTVSISKIQKEKLESPNVDNAMVGARNLVFRSEGGSMLSVEKCSDQGCFSVCFVRMTSRMETPRYKATVKLNCDSEKTKLTLSCSTEKM